MKQRFLCYYLMLLGVFCDLEGVYTFHYTIWLSEGKQMLRKHIQICLPSAQNRNYPSICLQDQDTGIPEMVRGAELKLLATCDDKEASYCTRTGL